MGRIYKITNDINNKIYIGQTIKTLTKRWQQHKCNSTKEYFKQIVLYKAFKKYGIEHFYIEEIEEVENDFDSWWNYPAKASMTLDERVSALENSKADKSDVEQIYDAIAAAYQEGVQSV